MLRGSETKFSEELKNGAQVAGAWGANVVVHEVVDDAKEKTDVRTAMTRLCDEHRLFIGSVRMS